MATFFGEVILPSSRAFFDDFDDDDDEPNREERARPGLCLHKHFDDSTSLYEALILSDGPVANGFIQQCLLKDADKLLAEVELKSNQEDNSSDIVIVKPKRPESSKLYCISNNNLLLQVSNNIDLSLANSLTQLIFPWLLKCKKIICIVSRHMASYRCDSINELLPAFVRGLTTTSLSLPRSIKHLEQPNFISHVPASVISWCEGNGRDGLLLVLYSDQETLDGVTVSPLMRALSDSGLAHLIVNQYPKASLKDSLKNMDRSFMYM